jgi:toxin YoeB
MGKYKVIIKPEADKHLSLHKKAGNKATLKKLEKIFLELSEHPFRGIGKPEQLKYNLSGYWSRQINLKDRLVYEVNEETVLVTIITAIGHYSDK